MSVDAIKKIFAVGVGAMGSGTALCFAMAGYEVGLYDLTDAAVAQGLKNCEAALAAFQKHGLVNQGDIPAILARLKSTTFLKDAASADFIIESVVENLAIKQKIFTELDQICPAHTIFSTNTSGLSPTAIAEAIKRKDKFVVAHFWNPPHLIPLVEVVPGKFTSQDTIETTVQLMKKIGKTPVALKQESLGFVGNRIQAAMIREALHIVASGIATAEDVDTVVKSSLGLRLSATGPLESADLGGLDVFKNIFSYLGRDLSNDIGIPPAIDKAVSEGRLGAKTGAGMYDWPSDKLNKIKVNRENVLFAHQKKV
jgi:3-hydroxybutyryl-CoA dehydrogenase